MARVACKSTYKQRFRALAETRANVLFIFIMSCGANKIFPRPDLLQIGSSSERASFSTVTTSRWTSTGAPSLPGYRPIGGRESINRKFRMVKDGSVLLFRDLPSLIHPRYSFSTSASRGAAARRDQRLQ